MTTSIEHRLKKIIHDHLNIDENKILLTSRLIEDLSIDSLDAMDLLLAINEEFQIDISPEQMEKINTVEEMLNAISSQVTKE